MKNLLLLQMIILITSISSEGIYSSSVPKVNENHANSDTVVVKSQSVSVIFWNIENLYDPYNDSLTMDDEFTADGTRHWSQTRFRTKINHIAKALIAAGGWSPPEIIGMCEVENRYVLTRLVYQSPLNSFNYGIIHHDSPDLRGVDVALLYQKKNFRILSDRVITIRYPFDTVSKTRQLLYVRGIFLPTDTVHFIVNHWPSRRGGQERSQPRRNYVGSIVRALTDSILSDDANASIILMGDFNDEPEDESLQIHLGASNDLNSNPPSGLYNMMGIRNTVRKEGTLKYRDQWSTFDQFIVSSQMLRGRGRMYCRPENTEIVRPRFLLEEDRKYFGEKLRRSYNGPGYKGGFSDHLPVKLVILRTKAPVTTTPRE